MSEFSEVLGALMISLVHARRLADEETAAVAEYYKDNPLLEGMSLPRVRVPELTIDMPVTFEQHVPAKDAELDTTANIHKALMEQFKQSLDDEDILSKTVKLRVKMRKTQEKGEIFTVLGAKNIILEKGGGAKISYFWEIYTPECKFINYYKIVSLISF